MKKVLLKSGFLLVSFVILFVAISCTDEEEFAPQKKIVAQEDSLTNSEEFIIKPFAWTDTLPQMSLNTKTIGNVLDIKKGKLNPDGTMTEWKFIKKDTLKERLIGRWKEYDPQTWCDGVDDILEFKNNGKVQDKTGIFTGATYEVLNDKMIKFSNIDSNWTWLVGQSHTYGYKFEEIGDTLQITFYNFTNLEMTTGIKNIKYIKLKY